MLTVLQRHFYYPFGMKFDGIEPVNTTNENLYQYNGKELTKDFGIDWYNYGARWYDAAAARWNAEDPLAEKMPSWSSYNYTFDNPILYTDPKGESPEQGPGPPDYYGDVRSYLLGGFAQYFAAIGRVIDDAGATISGWFGYRHGSHEVKYQAIVSTSVEDFFTQNGNLNEPVAKSPIKISFILKSKWFGLNAQRCYPLS